MPGTPCLLNEKRRNYFATEKFIFKICGISMREQESFVYKVYSFIVRYFLSISYPFVCLGDLNKHGFNAFSQIVSSFFGTAIASIASLTAHRYRVKLGKLLDKLEEKPFLSNIERGGDVEEKLVSEWALANKRQGLLVYGAAVVFLILGMLYGIVKRIRSSDSSEWINTFVYGPLTILDETRSPTYEISWLYQNIALCFLAVTLCTVVVTLSGTLSYICTQFQMLQNNLKRITKEYYHGDSIKVINTTQTSDRNNPLEKWKYLRIAVKEVVSYHINILEIISEVDDIFSIFMFSLFFIIICALCFVIYATTVMPAGDPRIALMGLEAGISVLLPLIICYWGEQVAYESAQVGRATYEANFVGSDLRFQKALNMIVIRSQTPARIKAGKLVETSMATFAWIIRSSISYFMIARNLKMKEQ